MPIDSGQFVEWFRSASPYIRVHRGKTFVIQFDDAVVSEGTFTSLVHDLALLNSLGIRLVLVYGARTGIESQLAQAGIALDYHKGIRITTAEAMEHVKEVVGRLRIDIESRLSMGLGNSPMHNADLRVSSGNYVAAKPLGVVEGIDFQFTGEIRGIDAGSIRSKLDEREIVLVPPLGYSVTGECFNLSADGLAARLAAALQADKLIYLMEADGLRNGNDELIRQMTQQEAEALLQGSAGGASYHHYLWSAVYACKQGVERVHLLDRRLDGAVIQELFTRDGAGTMISTTPYDVIRRADIADIPGLMSLIEPLEQQGVLVQRSREKLELEVEHFTVMERDGAIIGCGALYPFNADNAAELACLAVHQEYHERGRGQMLLETIEQRAREQGLDKLFVLSTHAQHWFLEHGFVNAAPEQLPVERKQLYNYQRNSKVMVKKL